MRAEPLLDSVRPSSAVVPENVRSCVRSPCSATAAVSYIATPIATNAIDQQHILERVRSSMCEARADTRHASHHRASSCARRIAPVMRIPTTPAQIATSLHAFNPRNGMFCPVIGTTPRFDSAT